MLIPSGAKVLLSKGCVVDITHKLGGNFTVRGIFGMARIDGENADAIGQTKPETQPDVKEASCSTVAQLVSQRQSKPGMANEGGSLSESDVWEVAKTVFDPEIPVNIVDLGLVYRLEIFGAEGGKKRVEADMTLTAPGCAMGPMIAEDLKMRLESLPAVAEANVNIVWDPPWNKDMMSEEAKLELGFL